MRTPIIAGLAAGFTLCAGVAGAASPAFPSGPRYGEDLVVELELPSAPGAVRRHAAEPALERSVWRWLGEARFAEPQAEDPDRAWHRHLQKRYFEIDDGDGLGDYDLQPLDADIDAEESPLQRWVAVDLDSGFEYQVELAPEFGRQLHARLRQSGLAGGYPGDEDPHHDGQTATELGEPASGRALAHGWSNGVDTRTRRFNNTTYPYRAMGQLGGSTNSGCSGTLIGRRHILTAAHCLWNMSSDSWVSQANTRFRPGREGTCNNASCEPYGEYNARWYFTPAEFRAVDNNWAYDYGIMVTWGYPGNQTGWLGYVAANSSTTRDYCDTVPFGPGYLGGNCFNRGYPACGLSGAPAGCVQGWAYQDVNPCEIGSFSSKGPDNWWSRVTVNCDSSGGHSGSALFTDVWNGSGKVVFAVASTHTCTTCGAGDDFPNAYRRVTPDVLSWISYFKTVKFP